MNYRILLAILLFSYSCMNATLQFTNINCTSMDEAFCNFEYCHIKAINRSYKYISLKATILQLPITDFSANMAAYKKANGYKPFLYNITVDGCSFLRNRKNVVARFMHDLFKDYSNMNHTCPYNHDLIVEKLHSQFLDNTLTNMLPMPRGEYLFNSLWLTKNKLRAIVKVYGTLS